MKRRIIILTAMVAMAINAVAQQGKWSVQQSEGDELKGIPPTTTYNYIQEGAGAFTFWGYDIQQFALFSLQSQFNTKVSGEYIGMTILVGIYDNEGKMTDKFTMWLDKDTSRRGVIRTRNAKKMFTPVGQEKNIKKIFTAMKSGKGYVRIVAERYNDTDFDIKIPPYKE